MGCLRLPQNQLDQRVTLRSVTLAHRSHTDRPYRHTVPVSHRERPLSFTLHLVRGLLVHHHSFDNMPKRSVLQENCHDFCVTDNVATFPYRSAVDSPEEIF